MALSSVTEVGSRGNRDEDTLPHPEGSRPGGESAVLKDLESEGLTWTEVLVQRGSDPVSTGVPVERPKVAPSPVSQTLPVHPLDPDDTRSSSAPRPPLLSALTRTLSPSSSSRHENPTGVPSLWTGPPKSPLSLLPVPSALPCRATPRPGPATVPSGPEDSAHQVSSGSLRGRPRPLTPRRPRVSIEVRGMRDPRDPPATRPAPGRSDSLVTGAERILKETFRIRGWAYRVTRR